jgi:starch synthase
MSEPLRILLAASEVVPFAKTGGLADVAGSLPQALHRLGHDVRIVLPKYPSVPAKLVPAEPIIRRLLVPLGGGVEAVSVFETRSDGVPVYLLDSPAYYDRPSLYGHADDHVRFTLFCRAIPTLVEALGWSPDVIHCNDWQTGLVPVYLKTDYADHPALARTATLYTIHNLAYQGVFDAPAMEVAGLSWDLFNYHQLEFYGRMNFMKGGIAFADVISTVSEGYALEIQTQEYGERLDAAIRERAGALFGILNGVDYEAWDPQNGRGLPTAYGPRSLARKAKAKAALREWAGLPKAKDDLPIVAMISRLTPQKGLDILAEVADELVSADLQFVVVGKGDSVYEQMMWDLRAKYPARVSVTIDFLSDDQARLVYAGSDFFLMPSRYEPCGLGQMYALKYGAVPIVRKTGGLADTVQDYDPATGSGNGFTFTQYTGAALMATVRRALKVYQDPAAFRALQVAGMKCDFSWDASARKYIRAYTKAIQSRRGRKTGPPKPAGPRRRSGKA